MMESADLGQRNDAALLGRLNGTRLRRILLEGVEVSARPVAVPEVAAQTTSKVCLLQDDDVVEKLAAEGSNDAFSEGVLPGRARRSENLGQAHALHSSPELATPAINNISGTTANGTFYVMGGYDGGTLPPVNYSLSLTQLSACSW